MDPMSAAASIVGLLGAAAKVSEVLLKFIGSVKGAPKLAQNVLMEVSDVSACLNQLQRYLQGALSVSNSQEQLLMVEQLVVTLSNCVMIFSELEETVESLKPPEPMQPWRLAQWLFKEQTISALLVRLQQSKLSLSLMLTTLTCTSIGQAQSSASQLTTLIQQVLESNLEISRRMANLEMRTVGSSQGAASTLTALDIENDGDSVNTVRATKNTKEEVPDEPSITVEETIQDVSKESTNDQRPAFNFTFDQDLKNSRPYTRAMARNSVWSTGSSAVHTVGWSCISGVSLADVSEISVIGLPVSPYELWNGHHYVLTGFDTDSVHEMAQAPVMDDLAYGQESSLSENESDPLESCKGTFPYNSPQSFSGSSGFGLGDRQGRKVPVTAGGRLLKPKKIILLGASMAGKTTIFHSLQMTHGNGFTDLERRRAREFAIHGLVEFFKRARRQYRHLLPIEDIKHFDTLEYTTRDLTITPTLRCYRALIALWSNPEIRSAIENGKDAAWHETVLYLLENVDILFFESTMPDEMLLRGCFGTTGVHRTSLSIEGHSCHVYNFDGKVSECEKWLGHCHDVHTVIFVVSLTGYCQNLPGTINENQMPESLMLFESIINLDCFKTVPIVLLFNRFNLLARQMSENPMVDYYPEYSGDSDPLAAYHFFAAKFSELDRRPHGSLRTIVTSAVEHDDFISPIDEIWPDLFQQPLTVIPEATE